MLATCLLANVLLAPQVDGSMMITWDHGEGPSCLVAVIRSNYLIDVVPSVTGKNKFLDVGYQSGHLYTLNTFTITDEGTTINSYVPKNQYRLWCPVVVHGVSHAKTH